MLNGQDAAPSEYVVDKNDPNAFQTIQAVIDHIDVNSESRIYIYVKPGVYKEKLIVDAHKIRISLIGEDADNTIITYDDYAGKGDITTFTSYTIKVLGDEFQAENITFQNDAPALSQVVVMHIEADKVSFLECKFLGNSNTIFAGGRGRQNFANCYIEGTSDFITGDATVVFDVCLIHSKANSYIVAPSTPKDRNYGFVFVLCEFTAADDVSSVYLGRPMSDYAKSVLVYCALGKHILPAGWHNGNRPKAERTVLFAECDSRGEGANAKKRVAWSRQLTEKNIEDHYNLNIIFTLSDVWIPD
jgi:pectinesterase